jgi:cyclohexanone monooxygenase
MIVSIEHHAEWITRCMQHVVASNAQTIETTQQAQDAWVAHVNAVADMTLFPSCNSWYLGANVPGKPRVFMPLPGFPDYAQRCSDVEQNDYRGFELTR